MKRFALLLLAALALPAFADSSEANIKKSFEDKLKAKVEKVTKAPIGNLYEVVADGQIFYTDEKAAYFLHGNLFEMKSMKNLTAEKKFSLLPLDLAIKTVRGSGKNVMVTFEDPNCGYCKKLAKDMAKLKDVTIYTFLYAVLGDDSVTKSKVIWCAADRSKAWNEWMQSGIQPVAAAAKCDASPTLDKVMQLGQQLGVRGTPFMMFANGQQSPGYIPSSEIEKLMGSPIGG
ncbi:MAG: DsbC family protein [Rhodocyclaceae bacterium]|nr:MAG: DsbC family protein [Rhodocyclaceae bacterium]